MSQVIAAEPEPHAAELPELLTVAEAAAWLKLSQDTVYKLCAAGELPAVRVGAQWRIRVAELDSRRDAARQVPQAPARHNRRSR